MKTQIMYPRTNYEMTEEDLQTLFEKLKPVPAILLQCGLYTPSPQERANSAWEDLGKKMGFIAATVRPINGKDFHFFTAVPAVTEEQKRIHLKEEAERKRKEEIKNLETEIARLENCLKALQDCKGIDLGDGNISD